MTRSKIYCTARLADTQFTGQEQKFTFYAIDDSTMMLNYSCKFIFTQCAEFLFRKAINKTMIRILTNSSSPSQNEENMKKYRRLRMDKEIGKVQEEKGQFTWWMAVMPDMLILLMSMSTLTLLSILMTASPSLSLMLSWNTISSGNLTRRWPGCVRAKKLARRDISRPHSQLAAAVNLMPSSFRAAVFIYFCSF